MKNGRANRRPGRYVDTRTRHKGVHARHRTNCSLALGGTECDCKPSYYGIVWDGSTGRNRRTHRTDRIGEARRERAELRTEIRAYAIGGRRPDLGFEEAHRLFVASCAEGVALNKQGRPYKRKAIRNLDSALRRLPQALRRQRLIEVSRGDFQRAIDEFRRAGLSGSRIRSIVNSSRALYRWAEDRELAFANPAALVRLPAPDSIERDRVATPGEFARLLMCLEPAEALPFALAAYGTARSQEIRALDWPQVDLGQRQMLLADEEDVRKSRAAHRAVPLVRPLLGRLKVVWDAAGCPREGRVCPPLRPSRSGMLALGQLQKRVRKVWLELGLEPIGLQDSRHTAATWLDHAGVSPKVASVMMGHQVPQGRYGAAPITLRRYTHVLPGEAERARDRLDAFLAAREREEDTADRCRKIPVSFPSTFPLTI
ncbi:MAG TPA: tyrosine-type recombinase/integrase [Solirubrobacterales bacterium]|jgi:integrase